MRKILVCAVEEEFKGADVYCGIGPRCVYAMANFLDNTFLYEKPAAVINYGTCGTFIKDLKGLHQITTFSSEGPYGFETQGSGGYNLLTQKKFVTEIIPGYDLVDCEAFYLKQICDKRGIEFECWKYITDEVGNNEYKDWLNGMKEGEECFKEFWMKDI
jgi:hypothetical protein